LDEANKKVQDYENGLRTGLGIDDLSD